MKEFETPGVHDAPNESIPKAEFLSLDDNQSISVSCKERHRAFAFQTATC